MTLPKDVQETEKNATVSKAETVKQSIVEGGNSEPAAELPPSVSNDGNPSDRQNRGAYCVWQEIHDSSTGYNYYWNVQTNEVTWDCPVEYTHYIQSTDAVNSEKDQEVIPEAENADEKNKLKEKKNMKNEGSVIPISYYGKSSSSDDSSDSGNVMSKSIKKQDLAKTVEVKKYKSILKVRAKCKLKNEDELSGEVIGPQLPPEFQFPQTLSEAEENNSETLASRSENKRDVEIDSVSPLKSTKDLTEKPSQSNLNEFSAESSQSTSCDISLEDNEKNCQKVHEQTGHENADFPEKRIENVLDHSVDKTNNSACGFRPVVEYDSFTDEDEDISDVSPSKQFTDVKCLKVKSFIQQNLETTNKSTAVLSTMGNEINSSKRKNTSDFKENAKTDLTKKPKTSNLDIDSLFTAHTSRGKYGLGWQKEENTANVQLHATSTQDQNTHANKTDYEVVNFIKSDDVLDFQVTNDRGACNTANNVSKDENIEKNVCEHSKNLKTEEKKGNEKKPVKIVEEPFVMKDMQKTLSENVVGSSSSIALLKDKYRNIKNKRKKDGNFSTKASLVSIPLEEDLDEIDRALCEALDAKKKAKNSTPKPPSPSPSPAVQDHLEKIIGNTSLTVPHEKNAITGISTAHLFPGPLKEKILETSSTLFDKLNFLLSAQSEVASLSGFFVQLQAPESIHSIAMRLVEGQLLLQCPLGILPLIPTHHRLHLEWCHARRDWNATKWNQVVFSDESHIQFRHNMTAQKYIRASLRFMAELPEAIFQQGNACLHKANALQDCICCSSALTWAAGSPDLPSIHKIWDNLGCQVGKPTILVKSEEVYRNCGTRCRMTSYTTCTPQCPNVFHAFPTGC
ncbi:WW domain-containing protein [Trichonephila clavipes]|nr:WW domain-containing protein [Trichonephila clavipes]